MTPRPAGNTRLGPYELIARIGKGGMGEVWKAHDTRLGRDVAVKLSAERFSDRFEKEARAIAALNHPNICTLFDVGPNYLVMELIDGPTLADRIADGPIPLDEAIAIAKQITDALDAAHEKHIVHRDLKPGNIKIRPDGSVKVLDFGLAKSGTPDTQMNDDSPTMAMATQMGVILGTAAYMAPEQARGKPVDKRADIWAFGVVLCEMVTGKQPFRGEDLTDTLASVVKSDPDLTPVPRSLKRLLTKCLQKDPKKRLRDIGDVWDYLDAPIDFVAAPLQSRFGMGWRGGMVWPVAAGVLALALAVLAVVYLRQPKPVAQAPVRFEISAPEDGTFGQSIRISPDGRRVAYIASGGGDARGRLWVRALDSLEARPLAGTEGILPGSVPFWLPDSRTLIFTLGGKLRKINVTGGPAQSICDFNGNVGGGFLAPDNRIVFGTPATMGIQACPAGGGTVEAITAFKPGGEETYHAFPFLLPDQLHFLFWRQAGSNSGIYAGSLGARPEEQVSKRVLPDASAAVFVPRSGGSGSLLFVREGTLMAQEFSPEKLTVSGEAIPLAENLRNPYGHSVSNDGTLAYITSAGKSQPTWVDRQGKTIGTLGSPGRVLNNMQSSPDGTRMAFNRSEPGSRPDIWIMDLASGAETRLTTDPAADTLPAWSPDGKTIAFASDREGTTNLYQRSADGAGKDDLLLRTAERKSAENWSPDGRFLLLRTLSTRTGADIWVLPMEPGGERKPIPYLQSAANETAARFSPDGRYVGYFSDESGTNELYVRPFDPAAPQASGSGPGKVRISQNGAANFSWRNDGKELLFTTADRKLWSVEVALSPSFRAGVPTLLSQMPRGFCLIMPDAQRSLCDVPVGPQFMGNVFVNWQAGLKR